MKRLLTAFFVAALPLVTFAFAHDGEKGQGGGRADLRVMSFNIRYATANDGTNAWPLRKDMLAETIKKFDPDLLGTQETLQVQAEFLKASLPGYVMHGVGRNDGKAAGEYAALFYRAERFKQLEAGHFWLSKEPDKPGSVSWDSALTRMVSWVLLKDQRTGQTIAYLNTHWDHRGNEARLESAKLMRKHIEKLPADTAVIVTGDFNVNEDTEAYKTLLPTQATAKHQLIDSYRAVHKERKREENTFHAFKGGQTGSRIDFILCNDRFTVKDAAIDRSNRDGKYPSDHYAVTATLAAK